MRPYGLQTVMADKETPISLSDLQLARMARIDTKTEEALLRRLYPKIFHIAWSIVGNRWLADEVTQVAALQVLKSLDSFSGVGSLESWAGRITCRVSSKMIKKEKRLKMMVPFIEEQNTSTNEPVDKALSRQNLFDRLVNEMERIPRKRRIPIQLHLVYGYTVNEVAEMTEVSPNTVKDRLRTAYKELRMILDEHPHLRAAMLEALP